MSPATLARLLLPALLLAACGVDGPPERPAPREEPASRAAISISGEAGAGVVGRS